MTTKQNGPPAIRVQNMEKSYEDLHVLRGVNFDVATGKCIRGPCKGQSLTPFPVVIEGDAILAAET